MNSTRFQLGAAVAAGGPSGPGWPPPLLPPALYAVGGRSNGTSGVYISDACAPTSTPRVPPPNMKYWTGVNGTWAVWPNPNPGGAGCTGEGSIPNPVTTSYYKKIWTGEGAEVFVYNLYFCYTLAEQWVIRGALAADGGHNAGAAGYMFASKEVGLSTPNSVRKNGTC